ncbi:MAG TPA: hypothetical protein VF344_03260 [Candidatus Limnocylindrales bacterium]
MNNVGGRAIELARSAVIGYLLVFVVGFFALVTLSAVALAAGLASLNIAIGPLPLMSFWNSGAGYGFETQWGIGFLAGCGAVAGLVIAVRRQLTRPV